MMNSQTFPQDNAPLSGRPPSYHSYVLRYWQERSEESASSVWRFSLEDPLTDQRYGFANFDALTAWLQAEMAKEREVDHKPD